MSQLAKHYILNNDIDLEGLILDSAHYGNFYQNLAQCIEDALNAGQVNIINNHRLLV